jgi:mannose-6-phosphate isomerase-like protein (cupin superfamily)
MQHATAQCNYAFAGVLMRSLLTGRETNNTFCLFENRSPGISATPIHVHEFEDETIFVLEGEMEAILDGESRIVRAGQALFLPRCVPHQLKNSSESPSRYSILCMPSGFEDFVAQAGRVAADGEAAGPPSTGEIQTMKEVALRFGIRLLPAFHEQPK